MKHQQKGFIVPLVLGIIAILALGAGTYYVKSQKSTILEQKVANTATTTQIGIVSTDVSSVATATIAVSPKQTKTYKTADIPTYDSCFDKKKFTSVDDCYKKMYTIATQVAITTNNINVCTRSTVTSRANPGCFNEFFKAKATVNPALCSGLMYFDQKAFIASGAQENFRDSCFLALATVLKDSQFCQNIKDSYDQYQCIHSIDKLNGLQIPGITMNNDGPRPVQAPISMDVVFPQDGAVLTRGQTYTIKINRINFPTNEDIQKQIGHAPAENFDDYVSVVQVSTSTSQTETKVTDSITGHVSYCIGCQNIMFEKTIPNTDDSVSWTVPMAAVSGNYTLNFHINVIGYDGWTHTIGKQVKIVVK